MKAIILGALFACLPILASNGDDGRYDAVDKKWTEVPSDIPSTAVQIILDKNFVSTIAEGTWDHLDACNYLSLAQNFLREVPKYMFEGLDVLEHLNLNDNLIHHIQNNALCPMGILKRLDLANNQLRHLPSEVFKCVQSLIYVDVSGNRLKTFDMNYHITLKLGLSSNPLQCDIRLCWLKEGERNGSLTWTTNRGGALQTPDCDNYPEVDWGDITLQCSEKVSRRWNGTNDTDTISPIAHETVKVVYVYDKSGWIFGSLILLAVALLILAVALGLIIWKCKPIDRCKTRNNRKVCPKCQYNVEQEEVSLTEVVSDEDSPQQERKNSCQG